MWFALATGEEALEKVRVRAAPDLVLLDLMLPGIDGLEVARRLKNQPGTREIPVVMLTAKGEEGRHRQGIGDRCRRLHHQAF
jgi:CheY-like chemotaxis protein